MLRARSAWIVFGAFGCWLLVLPFLIGCETSGDVSLADLEAAEEPTVTERPLEVAQRPRPKVPRPANRGAKPNASSSDSSDWASFRGPTGMGVSTATGLPVEWSQSDNIAWKTPLPGAGASSPIVFGDRIYLTAYTGFFVPGESEGSPQELKRHLLAIDRNSGEIVWDSAIPAKLPEESRIRDHGFAANTPAADADRIYAFFGKSGVYAFDHSGKELWHTDVGSKTHGWGTSASPVLYKDLVFINASVESDSLIALDRQTGEERWRASGIRESWNTPVVIQANGRDELIIARQGKVLAFNPETGDPLWNCDTDIGW